MSKPRIAVLLLVLVVLTPLLPAATPLPGVGGAPWPLGAAGSAPEQRGGSADESTHDASSDSTRASGDLPHRDQPRPAGAVADQAALPVINRPSTDQQRVTPTVDQAANLPALDPKATERVGDRTATTETFDNPDGSRTLRLHTGDSNVRQPGGSWRPIDLALAADAGRFKPKTTPVDVSFAPTSADSSLVQVRFDADHSLAYGLRDVTDVPGTIAGPTATYPGVRPGVDLRLTAVRTGVKEDLVLASAAARTAFAFTLRTTRLEPKLTSAGDIELVDGDKVVSVIPAGFMDDAAGVRSTGVRYGLDKVDGSTWVLRVDLDTAWLRDPARVFPVVVDPSVRTFNADADDTYVRSNAGDRSGAPELEVGSVEGQPTSRSYLRFGGALGTLRNQYIVGASLVLNNVYASSCTPRSISVFEVTSSWSSSMRWPGAPVGQSLASKSFAHGFPGSSCSQPAWEGLSLDHNLMTRWAHGEALPHGLSVRASDETDRNGKRFASANSTQNNSPYLDVRYSPEGASFETTGVLLPTNTRGGKLSAKVTNLGSSTWSSGGGINFGYIVKQGDAFIRTYKDFFANVAPMQTHQFVDLPIDPLAPGDYQVYLTMFTPQGQDFFVAHGVPYGRMDLRVSNVKPGSNYQQPGNGQTVETLTPTLYAEGVDDDNWPGKGLTYKFRICSDQALTADCQESDWTTQSWAPAALRWSKTYYWALKVYDTVDATPSWVGPLVLTTRVPQPQITSHLAGSAGAMEGPGLDPGIGNYSTAVTDASVSTTGPDLTITRTYNSLDPRRNTAFGIGWASRLDMRLDKDDDHSGNVVVTYPSGRQVRYGKNPDQTFAPPAGDSTELAYDTSSGVSTLRDGTGNRWKFDVLGRLVTIIDPAGLTEQLTYDTNDHVTTITSDTSSRWLAFTWQGAHVSKVTTQAPDPGGQALVWSYTYEGDRLTKACVPGGEPNCTGYGHTTGSHYRSSVLDDNPKAYWRLGETTGDTLANATARRDGDNAATQHGLVLGTDGALAGTSDKAATFDGNGSYATLPENLTTATMSLAVELWFKTSAQGTLISYADQSFPSSAAKSTPILYVGTDGLLYGGFSLRDSGGPRQIVTTGAVNDDKWHHAVLSAAINTQTLYLDGQKVGDLTGFVDHKQQTKLTLGAGSGKDWPATNGGNFHFGGSIDEVALYLHPVGSLAAAQHFGARAQIDELTTIALPQDNRRFATLTYDDVNDRVKTLVDHGGRTWTLDTPKVQDSARTAVLRGPSNHGEWTYTFDVDNGGRLVTRAHDGAARKYEYNTAGFLSAVVDESGQRTEQTTDAAGNTLSRKTCRATGSCNTEYFTHVQSADPLDPRRGKLESTSDARSSGPDDTRYRTSYTYDSAGRRTKTTAPVPEGLTAAPTESDTYSTGAEDAVGGGKVPAGLLVRTTGWRGQTTSYAYFANGDLAEVQKPTGLRVRYSYDAIGRPKSVSEANAGGAVFGTTAYEYTPRSQIAKVTEPSMTNRVTGATHTKVTVFRYDGNGNVLETTVSDVLPADRGGDQPRTTTMTYDAHDRLATIAYPDGGKESHSYVDNGLTEIHTDVKGIVWTSQSDERGLLLSRSATGKGVNPEDPGATGLLLESHVYDPAGKLRSSDDAMGRRTSYTYYDDGLPATVVREKYVRGDQPPVNVVLEDRSYDPAGNMTLLLTAGGRRTTQTFDAAGFLTGSTFDPDGAKRATTYRRDADGNPTRIETRGAADPNRVEATSYEYDLGNQVVRENAFLDATTAFSTVYDRDERGLVETVTDRRQLTTSYTYDAAGQIVTTSYPPSDVWVGGVRTASFRRVDTVGRNAFGEQTHSRDAQGGVTTVEYDSMGRTTKTVLPDYTPPGGTTLKPTSRTEYDVAGLATKVIDPLERVTGHEYDPYGRVVATTLPQVGDKASVIRTAYDKAGQVMSQTDPSGARTQFTYDELGRQITSTSVDRSSGSPLYYSTVTDYDLAGNPVAVTNPVGAVRKATYNPAGEVLTRTDPTGRTSTYTYDIAGRAATAQDPTGLITANSYDLLGRQTRTAQLVGGVEQRAWTSSFDAAGNVVADSTPQGRTRTYVHDEFNRVVRQVEQVDGTKSIATTFGYDKLGNRSRFLDGKGNATDHTYNSLGLPESVVEPVTSTHPNPADRTFTTSYDVAGQPVKLTKPGGVSSTREYDEQGRLTVERGSGAEAATTDRSYGHDLAGRVTRVGGARGDSQYRYDDRGNLIGSSGAAGTATFTYNGDSTVASRTDASGSATFGYDKAGRITGVVDALSGRTVDYGYDAAGRTARVADRSVSSWISRNLSYDALGRLTADQVQQSLDTGVPLRTLVGTEYGYDLDDKVTSKKATDTGGVTANGYGYDGVGRLTSWTDNAGATTAYQWDDAGNRTAAGATTYNYDQRNRIQSGGGANYTYTARGTLASVTENGQTTNSAFDAFDRMVTNGVGNYGYDGLDRVTDRNGTQFQYAGLSNEAVSDGRRLISRLPDGRAFADKASGDPAKGKMLYADQHGDVVGRYLGSAVDGLKSFDPFGKVTRSTGDTSPLGYQGDWTDGETGAVNMSARWYSPGSGQFMSRDDWTLDPTPSAAGNRYQYGDNDPVNRTDPSGHDTINDICDLGMSDKGKTARRGVWWTIPISMICDAPRVAGECRATITDSRGNLCPQFRQCPDGKRISVRRAGEYCASGPYSRDFWRNDDAIPVGNCKYFVHGCSGPPKVDQPIRPGPGSGSGRPTLPPIVIPLPPPPPPWLVFVFRVLPRLDPGGHVVPRPPTIDVTPPADKVDNKNDQYTNDSIKITDVGPDSDLFRQVATAHEPAVGAGQELPSDDRDQCDPRVNYLPLRGPAQASGVIARLCGPSEKLKTVGTNPSRGGRVTPAGYETLPTDDNSKAHLLAKRFGGSGRTVQNLVAAYRKSVNDGRMGEVEDATADALAKGEELYYIVTPSYVDGGKPTEINMFVVGNKGTCVDTHIQNTAEAKVRRGGRCG